MDSLGARIVADRGEMALKRHQADNHDRAAKALRREADEIERLLELARLSPQDTKND